MYRTVPLWHAFHLLSKGSSKCWFQGPLKGTADEFSKSQIMFSFTVVGMSSVLIPNRCLTCLDARRLGSWGEATRDH